MSAPMSDTLQPVTLDLAPGARPHFPVPRRAPLPEFERIADRYPVFRVLPEDGGPW